MPEKQTMFSLDTSVEAIEDIVFKRIMLIHSDDLGMQQCRILAWDIAQAIYKADNIHLKETIMTNPPTPDDASGNERAHCCQIDCKNDAVWRLCWNPYHYENTTDACNAHLGEMVLFADATEFHITQVSAPNPPAAQPAIQGDRVEAAKRLTDYLSELGKMQGIDKEELHTIHGGHEREQVLRASDIRIMLAALTSPSAKPAIPGDRDALIDEIRRGYFIDANSEDHRIVSYVVNYVLDRTAPAAKPAQPTTKQIAECVNKLEAALVRKAIGGTARKILADLKALMDGGA